MSTPPQPPAPRRSPRNPKPHLDIGDLPAAAHELEESVHRVRQAFASQAEELKRISEALRRWADALHSRGAAKPFSPRSSDKTMPKKGR